MSTHNICFIGEIKYQYFLVDKTCAILRAFWQEVGFLVIHSASFLHRIQFSVKTVPKLIINHVVY